MPFDLQATLRSFMQETGGDGSPARLRAMLLDDAAGEGRAYRRVIDAAVRAYEVGLRTNPAPSWPATRQQVATEIDEASASVAVNAWLAALGLAATEPVPQPVVTTPGPLPHKSQRAYILAFVALTAVVIAVLFALVRDKSPLVATDAGTTRSPGPTTIASATVGSTTIGSTTVGPTTTAPSPLPSWMPATCTALG
ncbi:MAG: hypothetical protein ABI658_32850, partial [Acidimicrobiales bacterium]